jgi:hypothetical protein
MPEPVAKIHEVSSRSHDTSITGVEKLGRTDRDVQSVKEAGRAPGVVAAQRLQPQPLAAADMDRPPACVGSRSDRETQ